MNSNLSDPVFWNRFQFGFTLTYHSLFPQLTMGLAWFLVYRKWRTISTGDEEYNKAVRLYGPMRLKSVANAAVVLVSLLFAMNGPLNAQITAITTGTLPPRRGPVRAVACILQKYVG